MQAQGLAANLADQKDRLPGGLVQSLGKLVTLPYRLESLANLVLGSKKAVCGD